MQIKFRLVTGKSVTLDLEPSSPISDIKIKLGEYFQIDPNTIKLLAGNRPVKDNSNLSDLNIAPNAIIQIITIKKSPKPTSFNSMHPKPFSSFEDMPITASSEDAIRMKRPPIGLPPRSCQLNTRGTKDPKNFPATVKMLVEMGFEKDKCEKALRAAFYNVDRAAEYLVENKIPDTTCDDLKEIQESRDHLCESAQCATQAKTEETFAQLTKEQKASIFKLSYLGYPRETVIQVYMACDMDESVASSCLLSMT